ACAEGSAGSRAAAPCRDGDVAGEVGRVVSVEGAREVSFRLGDAGVGVLSRPERRSAGRLSCGWLLPGLASGPGPGPPAPSVRWRVGRIRAVLGRQTAWKWWNWCECGINTWRLGVALRKRRRPARQPCL